MPLYLCRWPNGEISIVHARNRADALYLLDEEDNAEGCPIVKLADFMVHFSIGDEGNLRLKGFGEGVKDTILEVAYPLVDAALSRAVRESAGDDLTKNGKALVRDAVRKERVRVRARTVSPKTERGRRMREEFDMPSQVVDRLVRDQAKKVLDDLKSDTKPH